MAVTKPSLPHFRGPDVLDPQFQELVARGIPPYRARRQILEELQDGKRFIQIHVAEGVLTLEPQPLTEEEEKECRAALKKGGTRGYDTYYNILHDQAKPGGITEIAAPEAWGISLTVAIRDGHLLIDFLRLKYPQDSYSFALVNSDATHTLQSTSGEDKGPPPGATDPEKIAWAILRLRATQPEKLRLKGDALRRVVYAVIAPGFSPSLSSWARGKRLAREIDLTRFDTV